MFYNKICGNISAQIIVDSIVKRNVKTKSKDHLKFQGFLSKPDSRRLNVIKKNTVIGQIKLPPRNLNSHKIKTQLN